MATSKRKHKVLARLEDVAIPEGHLGYIKQTKTGVTLYAVKRKKGGTKGARRCRRS